MQESKQEGTKVVSLEKKKMTENLPSNPVLLKLTGVCVYMPITHCSQVIGKQYRPRPDAAECGI